MRTPLPASCFLFAMVTSAIIVAVASAPTNMEHAGSSSINNHPSPPPSAMPLTEEQILAGAVDKRAWKDLQGGWGKRGWQDMGSGWGKRGWQDMGSGWGKRGWQDMGSGWGKRGWQDMGSGWGKRDWQDMGPGWGKRGWQDMGSGWGKRGWQDMGSGWGKRGWQDMGPGWGKRDWQDIGTGWGKRGWQDMGSGWGKRGWQDMGTGWGKRAWKDMQGTWGKRAWDKFQGSWGKRNLISALFSQEMSPENFQDFLPLRNEDYLAAAEGLSVALPSSPSYFANSPYGGQLMGVIDAESTESDDQDTVKRSDWNNFRGSWGKRVPAWHHLKGLWGKRSSGAPAFAEKVAARPDEVESSEDDEDDNSPSCDDLSGQVPITIKETVNMLWLLHHRTHSVNSQQRTPPTYELGNEHSDDNGSVSSIDTALQQECICDRA